MNTCSVEQQEVYVGLRCHDVEVVAQESKRRWRCRCDCGTQFSRTTHAIRSGYNKSCGCRQYLFKDLTDQTFGRLRVIRCVSNKPRRWLCECSCGTEKVIPSQGLLSRHALSCGCLQNEVRKRESAKRIRSGDEAGLRRVFNSYRGNAKVRNLPFSISFDDFKRAVKEPCFYCGDLQRREYENGSVKYTFDANGIDRIDNGRGYVVGNLRPCCFWCNRAKNVMTDEKFVQKVYQILNHLDRQEAINGLAGHPRAAGE